MEEKKMHKDCGAHSAKDCDINDHKDLDPGRDDCGHYVNSGPGLNPGVPDPAPFCPPDPSAPPSANGDQDPGHGPGIE